MNKKNAGVLLIISSLVLTMFAIFEVAAIGEFQPIRDDRVSFSSQTTASVTGEVASRETDWYSVEAEPGLMSLSVSWGNSYDIDCYISTSTSIYSYLARGYTTNNPETCSYVIQTAGTYYIGIRMYTRYAPSTSYTATLTWYIEDGSGEDTIPPTVSITNPSDGSSVSDTISISASASDADSGVDYVSAEFNGISLGSDSSSPYSWTFDTTTVADGTYSIDVIAYDNAGNYATDSVDVTVDNGGAPSNQLFSGVTATSSLAAQYDTEMWYIIVGDNAESMRTVLTCGSADFDVYGRLGAEPTTSTYDWRGYTSGGEDVTFNVPGEGTWYIMVRSYSGTGSYDLTVTINEEEPPNPNGEKIAVFFWASDAGAQWVIDEYWSVLQGEGYTKIFNFKDTYNFQSDFNTVEAYEGPEDTVFFYLFGHGNNNGVDSYTAFRPSGSFVYSSDLRDMFDTLDAERIGYLIESCHSGGFPQDFHASPYLAMSTSDADHNAYAVGSLPNEGIFSDAFFDHVDDGYNAVDSFYYAQQVVYDGAGGYDTYMQYPQIADYSSYVWFN
jgi:hypothetical protein